MKAPFDPLKKCSEEEQEAKKRKASRVSLEWKDYFAIALAAIRVFLLPVAGVLLVFYLVMRLIIRF